MTRLNKYLAECGVCSRREADRYIDQGRVTVNHVTAVSGMQVSEKDLVEVNGKAVRPVESKIILAYNKPVGVTCTEKDVHAARTIHQALRYPTRLTYAGRLDRDSEGLLIMTNDGDLIQRMMKGSAGHENEYVVKVNKPVTQEFLNGMSQGVYLKERDTTTRPCKLEMKGKYTFHIVLTQGLNRQIRRMCQYFGYEVVSLRRIRVLNIELGNLTSNQYRELTVEERTKLYELCGMRQPHRNSQKG